MAEVKKVLNEMDAFFFNPTSRICGNKSSSGDLPYCSTNWFIWLYMLWRGAILPYTGAYIKKGNLFIPPVQYPTQFYFGSFSCQYPIICSFNDYSPKQLAGMKKYTNGRPNARFAGLRLLFALHLFLSVTHAQTITGTVSDEKGTIIPRVSVIVKGTSQGTSTDIEGKYSITAPGNATLVFSSVGFKSIEVAIAGRTVVNVSLAADNQNLGEVIVTALGIKKQARSLGYSATNVKPEELSVNRTSNVMNALQGKVAGVNISSLGTGPGGTSKIRIRGQ